MAASCLRPQSTPSCRAGCSEAVVETSATSHSRLRASLLLPLQRAERETDELHSRREQHGIPFFLRCGVPRRRLNKSADAPATYPFSVAHLIYVR
jgi:hypothetical protein